MTEPRRAAHLTLLGGETSIPQPGSFYAGWITSDLIGPFEGAPGTDHW